MKKLLLVISTILVSGSVLAAPSTATLVNANGSVMVNQGKQFVSAKEGLLLSTGDRVMVMEGANASVRYANGCMLQLDAGSLVTVASNATCEAGQNSVAQVASLSAAVGDGDGDCDGDNILDKNDDDIDGDGTLNPQDNQNTCTMPGAWSNATGTWAAIGVGLGLYFVLEGDNDTSSP